MGRSARSSSRGSFFGAEVSIRPAIELKTASPGGKHSNATPRTVTDRYGILAPLPLARASHDGCWVPRSQCLRREGVNRDAIMTTGWDRHDGPAHVHRRPRGERIG